MSCIICGNAENQTFYITKEMMFGLGDEFDYFQCSKCGCLQIKKVPENLAKYYPSGYYSFNATPKQSKIKKYARSKRDSQLLTGNKLISKLLCRLTPSSSEIFEKKGLLDVVSLSKKSRVLDVGCGAGELIYYLFSAGLKNSTGIDAYISSDIIYPNGLIIKKEQIEKAQGQYDVIMLQHSLKHMPNHFQVLSHVYRLLAPNGVCLINMPTVSSYAWKFYGVNWVGVDAPRHLCIHSIESMNILSAKTGFKVQKVIYNSWSLQFWGSIKYQKGIKLNEKNDFFSKTEMRNFEEQSRELNQKNQGDSVLFYLTKLA